MIDNTMFWAAIDNLAAARQISCSHMARISGIDITALTVGGIGCRLERWSKF